MAAKKLGVRRRKTAHPRPSAQSAVQDGGFFSVPPFRRRRYRQLKCRSPKTVAFCGKVWHFAIFQRAGPPLPSFTPKRSQALSNQFPSVPKRSQEIPK
jgi:hypothetical protein